ncbi:unnamed protein product [Withania somnifera]
MALELPSDLIQQAKISTRIEAGLPDYLPDDPSLPSIPSLSATVAAFDPSPSYLRCKHCQGRLLRGIQSLICIYCGHKLHQNPDVAPEPISFKSTVGYLWFLQALRLDGSEKVGAATEKNQVNKGLSSPHGDVLLSNVLDLKIRWKTELEMDNTITNKKLELSKSSFDPNGFDLDNFLSFPKRENISSRHKEHTVLSDNVGTAANKTVGSHEDLTLFENLRSSEPAVASSTVQTCDDFSGWEADFQSAGSGEQNVSNTSSSPISSAVDSGCQHAFAVLDTSTSSMVISGNQHEGSKSTDAFASSDIDLSAELDTLFGTPEGPTDEKLKDVVAVSPAADDWPAVDLWDSANPDASQKAGEILPISRSKDAELQNSSNAPSTSIDWFQDDTWKTHNAPSSKHETTNRDHDSFDDWNNLTSSAPNKDPFENVPAPKFDTGNGNRDYFDDWNTFTSSAHSKDPFENKLAQSNNDNNSNTELTDFSSNLKDMDFGSFSQSDPFSGAPGKEGDSAAPAIFSAVDTPSKVGEDAGHASENAAIHAESNTSKNDVDIEGIMSQMHDLSFMLERNLSIPSKSNISLRKD